MEFPRDCQASGFKPVLVVLDPTPNSKLDELKHAFIAAEGEAFIGEQAWRHLSEAAGPTMATFLELYVRKPLQNLVTETPEILPELRLRIDKNQIIMEIGSEYLVISRNSTEKFIAEETALPEDVDESGPVP